MKSSVSGLIMQTSEQSLILFLEGFSFGCSLPVNSFILTHSCFHLSAGLSVKHTMARELRELFLSGILGNVLGRVEDVLVGIIVE